MTQSEKVEMTDITTTLSNSYKEPEPQTGMVNEEVCYQ